MTVTSNQQVLARSSNWQDLSPSLYQVIDVAGHYAQGFVENGQLMTRTVFTCADARNTFDADGLLVVGGAGVNVPRLTYVPSGGVLIPVFWVDGQVTEDSGDSQDLDQWNSQLTSIVQDAIGLTGAINEAFTLTASSDVAIQQLYKTKAIANNNDLHLAFFRVAFEANPSIYTSLGLALTGGTEVTQNIIFDPSDGSYLERFSQGSVFLVTRIGNFWHIGISCTNNTTGNTNKQRFIEPAFNADGTITRDLTATGSKVVAAIDSYTTTPSFHPMLTTGGTTLSLAAEDASVPLGSWFNATKGTFVASVWLPYAVTVGDRPIVHIDDGTNDNRIALSISAANTGPRLFVASGGVTQADINPGAANPLSAGTLQKVAIRYAANDFSLHLNGAEVGTPDTSGTVPTGLTTFRIGMSVSGGYLYGGINSLQWFPLMPKAEANARTTL